MKALIMLMLLIPTIAQDAPGITVTEVDPASVAMPEEAWLYDRFEIVDDTWDWCGGAHRTDWPGSPNGAYHAHFGGYNNAADGLLTGWEHGIPTNILADPVTFCWDWTIGTTELPYRIDIARAYLYNSNGDVIVQLWERDNREGDGQWRRYCAEVYGLGQFLSVRLGYTFTTDFSNPSWLGIDNVAVVADRRVPSPGPMSLYLPLSMRGARQYQKCRVCLLQPSGSTRTICTIVDSCAGAGGYPLCPALPGLLWQWTTVEKYCVRY